MKKIKISLLVFMMCIFGYFTTVQGQIGINTRQPQAGFEILAKNPNTNHEDKEGVLIPRITRLRAQSITAPVESTLIYIYDISDGSLEGKTVDVTSIGFYYYNGNKWIKLINSTDDVNIYSDNGTLSSDRIVNQKNHNLNFTSNATTGTSHFTLFGSTLNVDAVNSRVGLGLSDPDERLDVNGKIKIRSLDNTSNNTTSDVIVTNSAGVLSKMRPIDVLISSQLYARSSPNGYWSNFLVGQKGSKIDFVGRTSASGAPDFFFSVFFDNGTGFTSISSINCSFIAVNQNNFKISIQSSLQNYTINFKFTITNGVAIIEATPVDGTPSGTWIQGIFMSLPWS